MKLPMISSMPSLKKWGFRALFLFMILLPNLHFGQELNCNVQVNYEQITSVNAAVFEKMKSAMSEFMNNNRWTEDAYSPEERIDCNILFTISENPGNSNTLFKGTLSVQCTRPVYGTNYETTVLSFVDKNVFIDYQQDQPIYFSPNGFTSSLSSLLSFYAYIILGYDYATFEKGGGDKYFQKANEIMSYAQQSALSEGWTTKTKNSRYEYMQEILNPQFATFRTDLYDYHRLLLDPISKDNVINRATLLQILQNHKKIHDTKPQALILIAFFRTKEQEMTNLFLKATASEKQTFLKLVTAMDPSNLTKYERVNNTL